jgi:formylglycine-generating enzyme required for sulfatase activity
MARFIVTIGLTGPEDDCEYYTQTSGATCGPHPVGQNAPNTWGLYDMSGNVSEMTWDYYSEDDYYGTPESPDIDPVRDYLDHHKALRYLAPVVVRGGSYVDLERYCRSAYRQNDISRNYMRTRGFRLVRTLR